MAKKKAMTASEMGKKGGSKKVPKGFSVLSKAQRKVVAKKAAAKRWGNNSVPK